MGPLTIALLAIAGLVLLNLGAAVAVRVLLTYKRVRESTARIRMRMREGVAAFAVEITDELPRALTTFERRLLRETLLETAHELSGAARERLAASFAERGFIAEAERGAALAHDAAPRARRRGHRRARRARHACPRCARACATASRSCASRARTR